MFSLGNVPAADIFRGCSLFVRELWVYVSGLRKRGSRSAKRERERTCRQSFVNCGGKWMCKSSYTRLLSCIYIRTTKTERLPN